MAHRLRLVLFVQCVEVLSQTCYTECLQDTSVGSTTVNVMMFNVSQALNWYSTQEWYDRKTAEFKALFPAIAVTLIHVQVDDMVNEMERDFDRGTNQYHAYIFPFMNVYGATSRLSHRLMDMSNFTIDNVNDISWPTIGRFYRAHASLFEGKVLTLPLAGDFVFLFYRRDIFTAHGMAAPRTQEEYVLASQLLNGTDLNGDGELDYGSCFPHVSDYSSEHFLMWVSQSLQYRGTSQGALFDTETMTPLLDNPAVQEAIRLWKKVAGPPEITGSTAVNEELQLWIAGRCAMTIGTSSFYRIFQNPLLDATTGVAIMPGSEKVWSREGTETVQCNRSFCRHSTQYQDGLVVNHAPFGQSFVDGAINDQIGSAEKLAAYTFLTWLMNDANMLEAVVNPPSWPNLFSGSFVKPAQLVPSVWTPYGWLDPALSMYCAAATMNMEHSNAVIGLRLPNALEYINAVTETTTAFWRGTGEYEDLDDEVGARLVSVSLTAAWQQVTERGDREALIVTYQKSLNIHVKGSVRSQAARGELFPTWSVYAVVGILGSTMCLAVSLFLCWLTSTVRQRQKLRARQRETWEHIADDAETYATSLRCPMALVSATNFCNFGCLTRFETVRDKGQLRVLDNREKIVDFQKKFIIVFLSHQWLASTNPDTNTLHFKTMCAAVRRVTSIAKVSFDQVFLWVEFCSIPQEHLATRELFLAAVPSYVSLCNMFIVIAPPTSHDETALGMSTHFREGWCRAELLARLVGSGLENLFFCESCDGSLHQMTPDMVHALDLNVFSGDFRCCSLRHVGCVRCDREKLRTPILGIYAQYLKEFMSDQGSADGAVTCVIQMEKDRERLLPMCFDFVQRSDDMSEVIQKRQLFGPLPEILEHRARSTTSAYRQVQAPREIGTSSVVDTPVVASICEEHIVDMDVPIDFNPPGGQNSGRSQRTSAPAKEGSARDCPMTNVGTPELLRTERGIGSCQGVETTSAAASGDGAVVVDLDVPIERELLELEVVLDLDVKRSPGAV